MTAQIAHAVGRLRGAGLQLEIIDGHLRVEPEDRINLDMHAWLVRHSKEVAAFLESEQQREDEPADEEPSTLRIVVREGPPDHFCRVPHVVFRQWMAVLGNAEFKVLCFLVDRIYGFDARRELGRDLVSYAQIQHGITGADGAVLTAGTGLSRMSVARALRALEERGLVARERQRRRDGRQGPTSLGLYLGESRVTKSDAGPATRVPKSDSGRVSKCDSGQSNKMLPTKEREISKRNDLRQEKQ